MYIFLVNTLWFFPFNFDSISFNIMTSKTYFVQANINLMMPAVKMLYNAISVVAVVAFYKIHFLKMFKKCERLFWEPIVLD